MSGAGVTQDVSEGMRRPAWLGGVCVAALVAMIAAEPAQAQTVAPGGPFTRTKSVGVKERAHPEYAPIGMHVGAFTVDPQVQIDIEHNDNIYGTETNQSGDTIFNLSPSVTAKSNWSQHALNLFANAHGQAYSSRSRENNISFQVGANGRLDIVRGASLSGNADAGRFVEARTSPAAADFSTVPIKYTVGNVGFSGVKEFNRLRVSSSVGWNILSYSNGRAASGLAIDESFRDRTATSLSGRADYAMTPDTAFFIEVDGTWEDYRHDFGLNRNSHGDSVRGGVNFELTNLIRGDVGVGWLEQKYDSPLLHSTSGLSVHGKVEWFPTQLTTVTFLADRSVQDSGLIGSAGYTSAQAGAIVDHELLRNLIVTGKLFYEDDNFLDANRRDKRTTVGIAATYLMNRGVGLTGGYSFLHQDSSGLAHGPTYDQNDVTLGVVLKY